MNTTAPALKEWPLWEVFVRSKQGLEHKHCGSLHASDARHALQMARDVYTRRLEGVSIWVVPSNAITASEPDSKDSFFDPAADKVYRHPTFYEIPEKVGAHVMAAPVEYLLHLADNALVLGQRNAEWCGHGPVLEEDLALANNSLDLIGQARLLYQHTAGLINADPAEARRFTHLQGARQDGRITEDTLAYFRDTAEFRNHTLMELPHHGPLVGYAVSERDYAVTIARNFLVSALMVLVWDRLQTSQDTQLAGIAAKSLKEVRYHLRHASDWLVRLGDGTDESHRRAQAALDHLLPYCEAFWQPSAPEQAAAADGTGVDLLLLRAHWNALVNDTLAEATLARHDQPHAGYVAQGHVGLHSEHLGFLLAEMQSLARAHPTATW